MTMKRHIAGAFALTLGLAVSACGTTDAMQNASLYSVKQPVVSRTSYVLDVATDYNGVPASEQQRLNDWFQAMDLRYGDRVAVEDPAASGAVRQAVSQVAARHGILLSEGAPVTTGSIAPGTARVVITRSVASVPGCPDWSRKTDTNLGNKTSPGYGCAVNGNLAAMIANPEDLLRGATATGDTVIMSSTKAIKTYRDKANTGTGELKAPSTGGN